VYFYDWQSPFVLPLMLVMGALGGALYASSRASQNPFQHERNPDQLMLTYIAQLFLDWLTRGPWRNPDGHGFYGTRDFTPDQVLPAIWTTPSPRIGFRLRDYRGLAHMVHDAVHAEGLRGVVLGQSERAGRFAGFSSKRNGLVQFPAFRRTGWLSRNLRSIGLHRPPSADISPSYGFTQFIVGLPRRLNPLGIIGSGWSSPSPISAGKRAAVHRHLGQGDPRVPRPVAVLRSPPAIR